MDLSNSAFGTGFDDHRGARQHRFMESADINSAFRELFRPLRANIRRGMTSEGQVYGLEMDACIPGELLGSVWIPPASRGVENLAWLADAGRRRVLFDHLFAERGPEALYAYVCERRSADGRPVLYVEVVSADAGYAAEYPVCPGQGWHRRDLVKVPHRRLDPLALA